MGEIDDNELFTPLSQEEFETLHQFLVSENTSPDTLALDALDGYLTAVAIGPVHLPFEKWFAGIWGPDRLHLPKFGSMDETQRIIALIVRHLHGIVDGFRQDPDNPRLVFESLIDPDNQEEYLDPAMWAYGFLCGMDLCREDWFPLFDDPEGQEALYPIYILGAHGISDEEREQMEPADQRRRLTDLIPLCVAAIYRFWQPYRQTSLQRAIDVLSRKPPIGFCFCGSGKRYPDCCGAQGSLH